MPKKKASPAWWKKNDDDVLIARLSMEDLYGLISSCADLAPKEWQKGHLPKLKKRFQEKESGRSLRAFMAGLYSGTGGEDRTLGQREAVILRDDSDLLVLTRNGLKTRGAWEDLGGFGHYGKGMEAVILDARSVRSEVPLQVDLHDGGLRGTLHLDLSFSGDRYRLALNLLDEEGLATAGVHPSLLTKTMLEDVIRRRMEDCAGGFEEFSVGVEWLAENEDARNRAETALQDVLGDWLPGLGMDVKRCRLRLQKSEKQLREKELQDQAENREYERKLDLARQQDAQHRKALAANDVVAEEEMRRLLVTATAGTENEVARINLEGFRERREAEREANRLDAEQAQALKAQAQEQRREQREKDADCAKRVAEKRQEAERGDLDLQEKAVELRKRVREERALQSAPPITTIPKRPITSLLTSARRGGDSSTSTEVSKCGNCNEGVSPWELGYCANCLQVKVHIQKAWFRTDGDYRLGFVLENAGKAPFRVSRITCEDGFRELPQQSPCYKGAVEPGGKLRFSTGVDVKKPGRRPIEVQVQLKGDHSSTRHWFRAELTDAIQVTDKEDPRQDLAPESVVRPMHFLPPGDREEFTEDGKIVTMATIIKIPNMYKQETMGSCVELTPRLNTETGDGLLLGRDSPRHDRRTDHALRFPASLDPDGKATRQISHEHWRLYPLNGSWHLEQIGRHSSKIVYPFGSVTLEKGGKSDIDLPHGTFIYPLRGRDDLGFKLVHTDVQDGYVISSELIPLK